MLKIRTRNCLKSFFGGEATNTDPGIMPSWGPVGGGDGLGPSITSACSVYIWNAHGVGQNLVSSAGMTHAPMNNSKRKRKAAQGEEPEEVRIERSDISDAFLSMGVMYRTKPGGPGTSPPVAMKQLPRQAQQIYQGTLLTSQHI